MNIRTASLLVTTLTVGAFAFCGGALQAASLELAQPASADSRFETVAFRDREEAGMLRRAYVILATGDHDYKGRRKLAMEQVQAAGDLLGMDLKGEVKDHERQALSDEKMREARGLLEKVLGAAEVKDQKRISKHINSAIEHINKALEIR